MPNILSANTNSEPISLADLRAGERATFLGFSAGRQLAGRLIALGFTPGVELGMVQNHRHGPLLVTLRGAFVAIGRGEASKIQVKRSL